MHVTPFAELIKTGNKFVSRCNNDYRCSYSTQEPYRIRSGTVDVFVILIDWSRSRIFLQSPTILFQPHFSLSMFRSVKESRQNVDKNRKRQTRKMAKEDYAEYFLISRARKNTRRVIYKERTHIWKKILSRKTASSSYNTIKYLYLLMLSRNWNKVRKLERI